jgi:hypothetical protein
MFPLEESLSGILETSRISIFKGANAVATTQWGEPNMTPERVGCRDEASLNVRGRGAPWKSYIGC